MKHPPYLRQGRSAAGQLESEEYKLFEMKLRVAEIAGCPDLSPKEKAEIVQGYFPEASLSMLERICAEETAPAEAIAAKLKEALAAFAPQR